MKYFTRSFIWALIVGLVFSPVLALAQDYAGDSGQTWQQWQSYQHQSSDLQQKIAALPTTANPIVLMPVLFGVGLNNIFPNFGDPRPYGRTHEGEDIMAVKGTPIVSPTPAVVIRIVTGASEGNAVYTANPGGETFVYMHLDRFGEGVVAGTVLAPGALIGYVGNTGNASGGAAHLHFEIHNSAGTPTNPFLRLTGELTLQEKISDLTTIFTQTSDPTALAQFLVTDFRSTFTAAASAGVLLPPQITSALAVAGYPVVTTPAPSAGTALILSRSLYQGISGYDVHALQVYLNAHGYTVATSGVGSSGHETNYFGSATNAAVIRFQIAHGIKPISPSVGLVGPQTRAALSLS